MTMGTARPTERTPIILTLTLMGMDFEMTRTRTTMAMVSPILPTLGRAIPTTTTTERRTAQIRIPAIVTVTVTE
jgi:hypothetical protein